MAAAGYPLSPRPTYARLKSIAVFTDFSSTSKLALRYSALIAEQFGSKISLVNTFPLPAPSFGAVDVPAIYIAAIDEEQCRTRAAQLDAELDQPWISGIQFKRSIWRGGIKDFVQSQPALDLIALGTSGKGGVGKAIFGSTAESLFRWSQVPVLTVGPESKWPEDRLKKILYAADFSPHSYKAYEYAITISERFDSELVMLHVVEGDGSTPGHERIVLAKAMEDLQRMLPDLLNLTNKRHLSVSFGSAAESIIKEASDHRADLIVMGARGAGAMSGAVSHFAGGVAYKVASTVNCPVLTVRH